MNIDYIIASYFGSVHGNGFIDHFMIFLDKIGNVGMFLIIIAVLLVFHKRTRKLGIGLAVTLILILLINELFLKNVIARPRPHQTYPDLIPYVLSELPSSKSMPSGHTVTAFAGAAFFFMHRKKFPRFAVILMFVFAFLMGFSRIYCVHHYFTDVIVGMFVGIIIGVGGYFLSIPVIKLIDRLVLKHSK